MDQLEKTLKNVIGSMKLMGDYTLKNQVYADQFNKLSDKTRTIFAGIAKEGISAKGFIEANKAMKELNAEARKMEGQIMRANAAIKVLGVAANFRQPLQGVSDLLKGLTDLTKKIDSVGKSFSSTFSSPEKSIGNFRSALLEFNKEMVFVHRTSMTLGRGALDPKFWNDLEKQTTLSRQSFVRLYRDILERSKGLPMVAQEFTKLAKTIADDFGGSFDTVRDRMERFYALQGIIPTINKQMDAFKQTMSSGFTPVGLKETLLMLGDMGADTKSLDFFMQYVQGADEATRTLNSFENIVAKRNQAIEDHNLKGAQSVEKSMAMIEKAMTSMTKSLTSVTERLSNLLGIFMMLKAGIPIISALSKGLGGLNKASVFTKGMFGGGGGKVGTETVTGAGGESGGTQRAGGGAGMPMMGKIGLGVAAGSLALGAVAKGVDIHRKRKRARTELADFEAEGETSSEGYNEALIQKRISDMGVGQRTGNWAKNLIGLGESESEIYDREKSKVERGNTLTMISEATGDKNLSSKAKEARKDGGIKTDTDALKIINETIKGEEKLNALIMFKSRSQKSFSTLIREAEEAGKRGLAISLREAQEKEKSLDGEKKSKTELYAKYKVLQQNLHVYEQIQKKAQEWHQSLVSLTDLHDKLNLIEGSNKFWEDRIKATEDAYTAAVNYSKKIQEFANLDFGQQKDIDIKSVIAESIDINVNTKELDDLQKQFTDIQSMDHGSVKDEAIKKLQEQLDLVLEISKAGEDLKNSWRESVVHMADGNTQMAQISAQGIVQSAVTKEKVAHQTAFNDRVLAAAQEGRKSAALLEGSLATIEAQKKLYENMNVGMQASYKMQALTYEMLKRQRIVLEQNIGSMVDMAHKRMEEVTLKETGLKISKEELMLMASQGENASSAIISKAKAAGLDKEALQDLEAQVKTLMGQIAPAYRDILGIRNRELEATKKIREGFLDVINEMTTGSDLVSQLIPDMNRGIASTLDLTRMMEGATFDGAMAVGFASDNMLQGANAAGGAPRFGMQGLSGENFGQSVVQQYHQKRHGDFQAESAKQYGRMDFHNNPLGATGIHSAGSPAGQTLALDSDAHNRFAQAMGTAGPQMEQSARDIREGAADLVKAVNEMGGWPLLAPPGQATHQMTPAIHANFSGGLARFETGGLSSKRKLSVNQGIIPGNPNPSGDNRFAKMGNETIGISTGEFIVPQSKINGPQDLAFLEGINSHGSKSQGDSYSSFLKEANKSQEYIDLPSNGAFIVNARAVNVPENRKMLQDFVLNGGLRKPKTFFTGGKGKIRNFTDGGDVKDTSHAALEKLLGNTGNTYLMGKMLKAIKNKLPKGFLGKMTTRAGYAYVIAELSKAHIDIYNLKKELATNIPTGDTEQLLESLKEAQKGAWGLGTLVKKYKVSQMERKLEGNTAGYNTIDQKLLDRHPELKDSFTAGKVSKEEYESFINMYTKISKHKGKTENLKEHYKTTPSEKPPYISDKEDIDIKRAILFEKEFSKYKDAKESWKEINGTNPFKRDDIFDIQKSDDLYNKDIVRELIKFEGTVNKYKEENEIIQRRIKGNIGISNTKNEGAAFEFKRFNQFRDNQNISPIKQQKLLKEYEEKINKEHRINQTKAYREKLSGSKLIEKRSTKQMMTERQKEDSDRVTGSDAFGSKRAQQDMRELNDSALKIKKLEIEGRAEAAKVYHQSMDRIVQKYHPNDEKKQTEVKSHHLHMASLRLRNQELNQKVSSHRFLADRGRNGFDDLTADGQERAIDKALLEGNFIDMIKTNSGKEEKEARNIFNKLEEDGKLIIKEKDKDTRMSMTKRWQSEAGQHLPPEMVRNLQRYIQKQNPTEEAVDQYTRGFLDKQREEAANFIAEDTKKREEEKLKKELEKTRRQFNGGLNSNNPFAIEESARALRGDMNTGYNVDVSGLTNNSVPNDLTNVDLMGLSNMRSSGAGGQGIISDEQVEKAVKASMMFTGGLHFDRVYLGGNLIGEKLKGQDNQWHETLFKESRRS